MKQVKLIKILFVIFVLACNPSAKKTNTEVDSGNLNKTIESDEINKASASNEKKSLKENKTKNYSNKRFKDVTVEKVGEKRYAVKGKAQVFEANFGWVMEDGHNELKSGFQMSDAGAPEWGKFNFTIEVEKQRPNSTLTLILFEFSAKDGSRQYELPIALP